MKRNLLLWQLGGVTFTAVLGTILHFLYEWTNLTILAPISAINESTWEHMKLVFFPAFFYAVFQFAFFKGEYANFWSVKAKGILIATILIPILFYTLSGVFGKLAGWINILIFFTSVFVGFAVEYLLFKTANESNQLNKSPFSFLILCIVALLFVIFTFYQPQIPLFLDPISNKSGFQK